MGEYKLGEVEMRFADFISAQNEKFVEKTFSGLLPKFLASFGRRKNLSDTEIEEIQKFIDERRG